ncbi:hypothetical protein AB4Z03_27190 [Bacillus sp. YAF12_1]|uniref:hypothetical protein n=1 Tax=Bacillus sp. YAF12_1 TaxID=3237484 RepID=UPI003F8DF5A5
MKENKTLDNRFWAWKTVIVGSSLSILMLVCLYGADYYKYLWGYIGVFLLGSLFFSYIWSVIFHYLIFIAVFRNYTLKKESENKTDEKLMGIKVLVNCFKNYICYIKSKKEKTVLSFVKEIIFNVFSPDYFYARVFKYSLENNNSYNKICPNRAFYRTKRKREGIPGAKHKHPYLGGKVICEYNLKEDRYDCEKHQEKKRLQKFVIYSNWVNVLSACILFIVCMILDLCLESEDTNGYIKFAFIFVTVRLISRAIEVAIAFYSDVVRTKMTRDLSIGERSTNLKRGHRISLVVHTYLEFVILFSILYFLEPIWINRDALSGLTNYMDFVLYSASVSAFNISFDTKNLTTLGKMIHTLQVFLCINLIVLSIATYLGFQDKMNSFEKADWRKENQD